MSLTAESTSASKLLSQINELLVNIALLNEDAELYSKIHLLNEKFYALEKNYNSLIETSTCNAQCENLNTTSDQNSVERFLAEILLSGSNPNPPLTPQIPSAPPEEPSEQPLIPSGQPLIPSAPPEEPSGQPIKPSAPPIKPSAAPP